MNALTSTTGLVALAQSGLIVTYGDPPSGSAPTFSTQPSFGQSTYNVGDAVSFSLGVADSGILTIEYFTLGGVDKTGELSGTTWPGVGTADEGSGTIALKVRATNAFGFTLSNEVTATLSDISTGTTHSFGALTLEGAGGVPKPSAATAIANAGGTNLVLSGGIVVPGSGGVTSGTVTFNDATEWTVSATANEYSVRSVSEMVAVNALGTTTLNNKTMRIRPGTYVVAGTAWLANRNFATRFTIASHDTPAFPGIGSQSHDRVRLITRINGIHDSYGGCHRITWDGVCIEGQHDRNDPINASNRHVMYFGLGTVTDLIWRKCWLKGDDEKIGVGTNLSGCMGQFSQSNPGILGSIGVQIEDCRISNLYRAFFLNKHGRKAILRSQIDHCSLDSGIIGWSGETTITDCLIYGPSGDRSFIQWTHTGGAAKASRDAPITGMASGTKGIFACRTNECTPGALGVIWALQPLGGTAYAQFEKTAANKFRFFARDSGGVIRVDLTSTLTPRDGYFYNILVSIDNAGSGNKMLIWESAPKQGAAPVQNTVSSAASGHTLHWNGGGMSIGANNIGTGGTNNLNGSAGRWYFHPNPAVVLDVANSGHKARFFDESIASGPIVEDYATFGQPVIDIKPSLAQWRASADTGTPVPNSGTGESVVMRTARNTVEAGHVDGFQGITNPGAGGTDGGGPINLSRNIYVAHELDGSTSANGGQGFFLEDIRNACYVNVTMRNNLIIAAGPNMFFVAHPDNARFMHNTLVAHPDFKPDSAAYWPRIRLAVHTHPTAWTVSQATFDRMNAFIRSNLLHAVAIDSGTMANNLDSPDTHPIQMDNTLLPSFSSTSGMGAYFAGSNGDGTGFDWSTVLSMDLAKQMFATNPGLNPPGVVKKGWDAYWNEASPWEGTCASFSVPSRSGPGESSLVVPGSVSAGGIAVHTNGFQECRLFDASDNPISEWTLRPLHLSAGEKFRVRRLSGTGTTTVYAGDKTANWTVT